METKASSGIQLLPGFRFHPSDEELIVHYLKNKVISSPLPASIIADIDLYKYNPWELPSMICCIQFVLFLLIGICSLIIFFSECCLFPPSIQRKLCLERMNGISLHQGIGSTQMEPGLTGQQPRVIGRRQGQINQFLLHVEQ